MSISTFKRISNFFSSLDARITKHNNKDMLNADERAAAKMEPWYIRANPCYWEAYEWVKPIRPILNAPAVLTGGCLCCTATRIYIALFLGLLIGHFMPLTWTMVLAAMLILVCMGAVVWAFVTAMADAAALSALGTTREVEDEYNTAGTANVGVKTPAEGTLGVRSNTHSDGQRREPEDKSSQQEASQEERARAAVGEPNQGWEKP